MLTSKMLLKEQCIKITVVCVETFYGALSIRNLENVSVFNLILGSVLAQLCFPQHIVNIFPLGFDSNFLAHPKKMNRVSCHLFSVLASLLMSPSFYILIVCFPQLK